MDQLSGRDFEVKMKEKTARITTVNVVHLCMYLFVFHQIKLLANSKSSFGMDASMAPPSKCFCMFAAPRLSICRFKPQSLFVIHRGF